jgi:DNA-binding SARP family transcriptional activator
VAVVTVRVILLGRMSVQVGDHVIEAARFPGRQGRIAFAYLAVQRHPVTRTELADVIWGDDLPDSWERHLSAVMSKLRSTLVGAGLEGEHLLIGGSRTYELRLPPDAEVDLHAAVTYLEDAEAALRADHPDEAVAAADVAANLARRPLLPGEEGAWIDEQRRRVRAVLVRALEIESDLLCQRGEVRYALRLAEEAVAVEPFRESCWVGVMRINLAAGNRAEGLLAYERCRTILAEELGVAPSSPTQATYTELLRAD